MLQVIHNGNYTALWMFSDRIISIASAAGLWTEVGASGLNPRAVGQYGISVEYVGGDPEAGTPWMLQLPGVAITFASGNALVAGSGLIVE